MALSASQVWANIESGGKQPFLASPKGALSYADLHSAILRWLGLFDKAGLQAGDRVLIRTQNELATISAFLAAILDTKVAVALEADTPTHRRDAIAGLTQARCLIDDTADALDDKSCHLFTIGSEDQDSPKAGFFSRLAGKGQNALNGLPTHPARRIPACDADKTELAYLLFTSGTTGEPAGVMITHGNLFANLATLSRLFAYDSSSRIFNDMALAHADGMIQGPLLAAANRCAAIRAGGFSLPGLEDWLGEIRRQRATHAILVPTIWSMIDTYAAHDDYFDAAEMRSLQSVAAKLDVDLWHRIEKRFGVPLANHYGLTETVASAIYSGPHPEMGPVGSLGCAIDCEARIAPEADGAGELQLRGDNVFTGYWRNEDRTRASFTCDGWMRTGDLAERNEDGSFAILGRLKNIIMCGGFLIRPDEIDEVMLRHGDVRESVTVALDDEMLGEIPVTAVVLKASDQDTVSLALIDHARAQLEGRKVPKQILVLETIPRGLSGKADLKEVRALLIEARLADAGASASINSADDLEGEILALAAGTFRCKIETLSPETGPGDIAGWDSFSHLNLILEAERQFNVRLPAAKIAKITKLADLAAAVSELR